MITFFLHFIHTNEIMNRKTNVPTEQQKKVQKTQKKRIELDNTLEAEQSNKHLKTADQGVEGIYFIHITF